MIDPTSRTPLQIVEGAVAQYEEQGVLDTVGIWMTTRQWRDLIESQAADIARKDAALREAEECFALAEPVPIVDPRCRSEVAYLADRYGYGAMMTTASALWREKLGDRPGGEFVSGPCRSTVQKALSMIRAAIILQRGKAVRS